MAERAVAGSPLGRIAGTEAKSHGWERLSERYAETLGIPTSGWPEESRWGRLAAVARGAGPRLSAARSAEKHPPNLIRLVPA